MFGAFLLEERGLQSKSKVVYGHINRSLQLRQTFMIHFRFNFRHASEQLIDPLCEVIYLGKYGVSGLQVLSMYVAPSH